jgi:DNA end-binding protein Ku
MARSMWRGAIQFGLVTIPVKLYLATEQGGIGFNMLHKTCLNRIQMKIWCPYHEEVIPRSETVRGYEWTKDKYVVITDEDLESVPLKTVRAIEIEKFVDEEQAEETASRFVKQAYYLEPDRVGRKAFQLLKEVLQDKGLTAICKIVIRDREALAAMDPFENTMLLSTLYWPDEIRALGELDLPQEEAEIKPAEKKMAAQLIEAMTGEFDPAQYRDEYREALMQVIESKIEGRETVEVEEPAEPTKLVDLMAALQASVSAATSARDAKGKPVSVAEAKEKRAAGGKTAAKKTEAPAEEEREERPARRRKSA